MDRIGLILKKGRIAILFLIVIFDNICCGGQIITKVTNIDQPIIALEDWNSKLIMVAPKSINLYNPINKNNSLIWKLPNDDKISSCVVVKDIAYIGTRGGELFKLALDTYEYTNLIFPKRKGDININNLIFDGINVFSTSQSGLFVKFIHSSELHSSLEPIEILSENFIYGLLLTEKNIWISTDQGIIDLINSENPAIPSKILVNLDYPHSNVALAKNSEKVFILEANETLQKTATLCIDLITELIDVHRESNIFWIISSNSLISFNSESLSCNNYNIEDEILTGISSANERIFISTHEGSLYELTLLELESPLLNLDTVRVKGEDIPLNKTLRIQNLNFQRQESNFIDYKKSMLEIIKLANLLKTHSNLTIQLHGHTDINGNDDSSNKLSIQRVNKVRKILIKKGIDKNRILTFGHGKHYPISSDPSKQELNRRVEIIFDKID